MYDAVTSNIIIIIIINLNEPDSPLSTNWMCVFFEFQYLKHTSSVRWFLTPQNRWLSSRLWPASLCFCSNAVMKVIQSPDWKTQVFVCVAVP